MAETARICPDGFTFTTQPRTFRAGTYTQYAYDEDESGTHPLGKTKLRVISPTVSPDDARIADDMATFTARPGPHTLENGRQAWDTGLITTEGSREGFRLRPGDHLEVRAKLPATVGAWPSVWTWAGGGHEINVFEYHPDAPDLLEMVNHVRYAANYDVITPLGRRGLDAYRCAAGH
ncbi:hypothetical protein [Streptomyces barringtoniae]|uniref:hypothetical protein n=1 Tax=Streptomyces barringtoniae TaxID=2892029 RepID=UPI001E543316|nr:hypothetical protein [Streptomyces barringtoniae]MCC5477238.1 hypothetical protein [Streptomyces barringtoniae]